MGNDNYPLAFFVWILLDNVDKENTIVFAGCFNSILCSQDEAQTDTNVWMNLIKLIMSSQLQRF